MAPARSDPSAAMASPAVVAQQLSELLMAFPSAASEGVAWQVLSRKFEERHKARLDLQALGHTSQLAAATTLLWDVLRLVDTSDHSNIVVGVEDAIALTPRLGALGCWPSLYRSLCDIVTEHGTVGAAPSPGARSSTLLLSQIRPLLERYWHAGFDESGLGFMNEDGSFVRLKKLKHLLHAVLRWRDQHQAWRRRSSATKSSAIDEALAPCLRLVASDKHNDLLLQCIVGGEPGAAPAPSTDAGKAVKGRSQRTKTCDDVHRAGSEQGSDVQLDEMQRELERLRNENSSLRVENMALQQKGLTDTRSSQRSSGSPPCTSRDSIPQLDADIFDDPFEPPPEALWISRKEVAEFNLESVSTMSYASSAMSSTPQVQSGAMTPMQPMVPQQACAFVPMWFFPTAFAGVDVSVIPRGIVETARAHFESLGAKESACTV